MMLLSYWLVLFDEYCYLNGIILSAYLNVYDDEEDEMKLQTIHFASVSLSDLPDDCRINRYSDNGWTLCFSLVFTGFLVFYTWSLLIFGFSGEEKSNWADGNVCLQLYRSISVSTRINI